MIRKIAKRHNIPIMRGRSKTRKVIVQKSKISLALTRNDIERFGNAFSRQAYEMSMGSLLGDAFLKVRQNKYNSRYNIYFAHSVDQRHYLEYKREFFSDEEANDIRIEYRDNNDTYIKGKKVNQKDLVVFSTKSYNLSNLHRMLYKNNVKRITMEYLKLLTPLSLATWYMDDGSYNKQNRLIRIATMCFTNKENNILKDYFYNRLKMPCFLEKVNCGHGRSIVLTQNSTRKFLALIYPYACKMMQYKFPNDPSETLKAVTTVSKEALARVA